MACRPGPSRGQASPALPSPHLASFVFPPLPTPRRSLVDEGLIKSLGVSNFRVEDLEALVPKARHPVCVNQIECHPRLQQPDLEVRVESCVAGPWRLRPNPSPPLSLLNSLSSSFLPPPPPPPSPPPKPYCAKHTISLASYAPLTGISELPAELKTAVDAAATRLGVSAAMVLLRWNLQTNHIVVTTSTKPARCETLSGLYDIELTADEVKAISDAGKKAGENRVFWRKAWGLE